MFKKFSKDSFVKKNPMKSSAQRAIRNKILEQYPKLEPYIDDLFPKKTTIVQIKCANHINLIVVNDEVLFFNEREGPYFPHLKLLHKYPFIMTKVQVDRGAIPFVLKGSNVMCPGLTSKGGKLDEDFTENTPVAIMAEGKEHALGVGLTKMSRQEIIEKNNGIGLINVHCLDDGLWHLDMKD